MVEYQDVSVEEIARDYIEGEPGIASVPLRSGPFVRGMATEDASMSEESVFYDIRYVASAPSEDGLIGLIINVEGQNRFHPGYPLVKRGIYYCSRMLAAEYGTECVRTPSYVTAWKRPPLSATSIPLERITICSTL